jgi:hypothetical protein
MQNFEKTKKTKNKDLATSPDIRVVVETLFFFVFFCFFCFFVFFCFFLFFLFFLVRSGRSSRKEEVASQSANLRTKHCEDDNFAVRVRRLCSSGWRIL